MPNRSRLSAIVALIEAILLLGGTAKAQWTDKVTDTPSIIQTDFGPYGQQLPGDGLEYCGPTSATMLFFWLGANGYTQLAPSAYTEEAGLNLDRVLGGLMGTSQTNGTDGDGFNAGMETYLNARGVGSRYSMESSDTPDLLWLDDHNQNQSIVMYSVSWGCESGSTDEYTFQGGHVLPLLALDLVGETTTINNAWPYSFYGPGTPNVPSSNPQIVSVKQVPADWILDGLNPPPSSNYVQVETPVLGPEKGAIAVLTGASSWTVDEEARPSVAGYTADTWTIDSITTLDTNGGDLEVLAPLLGAGGFLKEGLGDLVLTATNSLSGVQTIEQGVLASTVTSGTPFGTGSVLFSGDATLRFHPDDTTPSAVTLGVAGGAGNQVQLQDATAALEALKGANASLTIVLGGNTDGSTPNLVRTGAGTVGLKPDAGLSSLGNSIRILLAGSGGNLPSLANGMVAPWLLGVDNDGAESGAFLTYDPANGYLPATPVDSGSLDLNAATDTTIYRMVGNQSVDAGGTATVKALQIDGFTLGSAGGTTSLRIGTPGQPDAGLIFNGGTVEASVLDFGNREALVYTSLDDGTLHSVVTGTGDFVKFGKGTLSLTAANQNTGMVQVNAGTLRAANSTGSATGSGAVQIQNGATLRIEGLDAMVSGPVTVDEDATLLLEGGSAGGALTVAEGATLRGTGTIAGTAHIDGNIAGNETGDAGTLRFTKATTITDLGSITWRLNELTDLESEGSSAWNQILFLDMTYLGMESNGVTFYVDFADGIGPESAAGEGFWSESHQWVFLDFRGDDFEFWPNAGNFDFENGLFDTSLTNGQVYITYSPIPEPSGGLLLLLGLGVLGCRRRHAQPGRYESNARLFLAPCVRTSESTGEKTRNVCRVE